MKLILNFTNSNQSINHEVFMDTKTTVGRSSKNNIQIKDEKISSVHCQFLLDSKGLEILDLDSKNGIYLNGIRIESSEIFTGDEIRFGETKCKIHESLSDGDALEFVTFPGRTKERIAFELRADFTGARTQNQTNFNNKNLLKKNLNSITLEQEIALRKKAKSPIKLSKIAIHQKNKMASHVASIIDYGVLFLSLLLPLTIIHHYSNKLEFNMPVALTIASVIFSSGNFYLYNFKRRKHTIGEQVSGIQKLFENQ